MPHSPSRLLPSRRLPTGLFGYRRADVQAHLADLEVSERSAVEIWTRAIELEREAVARARERALTLRDMLHHLERETASLEAQVATTKAATELMDVGAQHEIYRLEQIYQLRREQLAQLVPAVDRERQKIDQGLRQMMASIRETMLQTTASIRSDLDHDSQFAALAPVLFGSEMDASQVTAHPLAGGRTRLQVPPDRLRAQSRDGKLTGPVAGVVVSGIPPRVLGYVIGSSDDTERAVAAEDVVAIGQHTVMVRPGARLLNLSELPEVPAGQALRAVSRLSAPDLDSIGQATASLGETSSTWTPSSAPTSIQSPPPAVTTAPTPAAEPGAPISPVSASDSAYPSGDASSLLAADASQHAAPPPSAPSQEVPMPPPLPPSVTETAQSPAAGDVSQPDANRSVTPAPLGAAADPSASETPSVSPLPPPDEPPAIESLSSEQVVQPRLPDPAIQSVQVARSSGPNFGPTVSELAGLLPPPSWQVDVPAPVAGSDLLPGGDSSPGPTPILPTEMPAVHSTHTAAPPLPPPPPPTPPRQARTPETPPAMPVSPSPMPEMGGVSAGGAIDVLAFLEGKLVGQDIYNSAGELLAAKDMMIDAALVQRVDAAGRLPELIVYMTLPGLDAPSR